MRAAIYARVSTERQERQQTIDSQLTALRAWAGGNGHALADEHVFRDEGYSGGRLDRPGLDALRDAVRDEAIGIVGVLTPDRLARMWLSAWAWRPAGKDCRSASPRRRPWCTR
jgi:site-specific DNA recombinase